MKKYLRLIGCQIFKYHEQLYSKLQNYHRNTLKFQIIFDFISIRKLKRSNLVFNAMNLTAKAQHYH